MRACGASGLCCFERSAVELAGRSELRFARSALMRVAAAMRPISCSVSRPVPRLRLLGLAAGSCHTPLLSARSVPPVLLLILRQLNDRGSGGTCVEASDITNERGGRRVDGCWISRFVDDLQVV